jgi:hypothetical protein
LTSCHAHAIFANVNLVSVGPSRCAFIDFAFSSHEFACIVSDITIRFGSKGYTQTYLNLTLVEPDSITQHISYDGSSRHFNVNEWNYLGSSALAFISLSPSSHTDAVFVLPVERYGSGVVVRLAIPITMLLVLAGCTFWVGHPESRISATSGLIIAVTALYIVLISNVPFVGYATRVDTFVLVVRDALL